MDEKKLVRKAVRGNTKAYGQLIEQHKELLYRIAHLRLGDEELALSVLPEKQRMVIILKYYNDMKISENAQVYDVTGETEELGGDSYVYTASDSGYTFTVSEAYCDGDSLYPGLTVKKDGDFGNINSIYVEGYGETDYGYSYWIEGVR